MSSIRKWLATKVFSSVLSNDTNNATNDSTANGDGGLLNGHTNGFATSLFGPSTSSAGLGNNNDPYLMPGTSNSTYGYDHQMACNQEQPDYAMETSNQSYFSIIYHHYYSRIRKARIEKSLIRPNEKILISLMYQFYQANEELNYTSSELDTFDGRKDTDRCSALVNNLKKTQDRVISLIFNLMDEIGCERSTREYRLKFPDELLTGEGIESLNSQIWFVAECLTAGSTITNNQDKSNYLRPIAINLTTTLDQIRYELRSCCNYLPKPPKIPKELVRKLENFDQLFSSFEYDYVKTMLQIKTENDIEHLQELTILFYDTLRYSLNKNLITKDDVDGCQPSVMIALPRLSIVYGLLRGYSSVVCKHDESQLTTILRPYHNLLLQFNEFLSNLNENEIYFLEKLLSTNYDNLIDYSIIDNQMINHLLNVADNNCECDNQSDDNNNGQMSLFHKFIAHSKRNTKDSRWNHRNIVHNLNDDIGNDTCRNEHFHNHLSSGATTYEHNQRCLSTAATTTSSNRRIRPKCSTINNRYISASVDFLSSSNNQAAESSSASTLSSSSSSNSSRLSLNDANRFSTNQLQTNGIRFCSLPNLNINSNECDSNMTKSNKPRKRFSSVSFTDDTSSCPSVSIPCSLTTTSSSSSSSSVFEIDFLKKVKDMLKRTQLKTSIGRNSNRNARRQQRSTSSGGVMVTTSINKMIYDNSRCKTSDDRRYYQHHHDHHSSYGFGYNHKKSTTQTQSANAFSCNSVPNNGFDTDDHSEQQLDLCTRKILHQAFVMISRIADEFQTNYASELRNILRTVFMLQNLYDEQQQQQCENMAQTINRLIDCNRIETIEEALDACNEYLNNNTDINDNNNEMLMSRPSVISNSVNSSHHDDDDDHRSITINNCNHINNNNNINTHNINGDSISCDTSYHVPHDSNNTGNNCYDRKTSSSLDDIRYRNCPQTNALSSTSLNEMSIHSTSSTQHSTSIDSSIDTNESIRSIQPTSSLTTNDIDTDHHIRNGGDLPPFLHLNNYNNSDTNNNDGSSSTIIPIIGSAINMIMTEPSTSSTSTTVTRLLLPPVWKPDDSVTGCESCSQQFTFMRRRHHCRRCGRIFCNQCSSNFVTLRCFGYFKPVRVCDQCFVLQQQHELHRKYQPQQQQSRSVHNYDEQQQQQRRCRRHHNHSRRNHRTSNHRHHNSNNNANSASSH